MRDLINYLFSGRQPKPEPVERRSDLEPFEFEGRGLVRFQMASMHRLEDIAAKAAFYREQMEALAAEACELLNCDPSGAELDTDYATEIVYMGTPIGEALDSIITYRNMKEKECQ